MTIKIFLILFLSLAAAYLIYALIPTFINKRYTKGIIRNVNNNKDNVQSEIILTFDDGPDARYTNRLLDILKENDVRAVFFVVARKAYQNPGIIKRMIKDGHKIGFHSAYHQNALLTLPGTVKKDFMYMEKVKKELNLDIVYYRPPWGHFNLCTLYFACKYAYKIFLWSVMAEDWNIKTGDNGIVKKLLTRVKCGSIICLHDSEAMKKRRKTPSKHWKKLFRN